MQPALTQGGALEAVGSSQPAAGDTTQQTRAYLVQAQPDTALEQSQAPVEAARAPPCSPSASAAAQGVPHSTAPSQQPGAKCTQCRLMQSDTGPQQGQAQTSQTAAQSPAKDVQGPSCSLASSDAAEGVPDSPAAEQPGTISLQRELAQPDASPGQHQAHCSRSAAQAPCKGCSGPPVAAQPQLMLQRWCRTAPLLHSSPAQPRFSMS